MTYMGGIEDIELSKSLQTCKGCSKTIYKNEPYGVLVNVKIICMHCARESLTGKTYHLNKLLEKLEKLYKENLTKIIVNRL